jgi:hypothetical protein
MSHPFPQALQNEHLHRFEESLQLQSRVLELVVVYFFPAPLHDVCTYLAYLPLRSIVTITVTSRVVHRSRILTDPFLGEDEGLDIRVGVAWYGT